MRHFLLTLLTLLTLPSLTSAEEPTPRQLSLVNQASAGPDVARSADAGAHPTTTPPDAPATPTAAVVEAAPPDGWAQLSAQFDAREQYIRHMLTGRRLAPGTRDAYLARVASQTVDFCNDFDSMDALGSKQFISTALPIWKTLWSASKPNSSNDRPAFIPELIALIERCDYSRGALYRAAFVLEYMYWNRMVDRTGMEVADALIYRDFFYELKFMSIARDKIAWARGLPHASPRTEGGFFEAREMRFAFFLRFFGVLTTSFPPRRRRAYMSMVETLDLRRDSMLMFGNDTLAMLDSPDDLRVMADLYDYLLELQADPKQLGAHHGGWHRLMTITGGDRVQAVRVIGLLASLRGWVLEELSDALLTHRSLGPEQLRAFYSGANAYFLMNQLNERSALNGKDPYTLIYHFFYPPEYESVDWKTYHWYANAHLGCQLAKKGMDARSARLATRRLAQAYEALTLNLAIPTKRAMGEEPRARPIIEGWEDVNLNAEGGAWGWSICAP